MAADRSRTVNQALVIHDPRISMDTFDSVNSTVTQTGPSAGVPEPSVVTQMALQASGEQTEAITVFTAQAGGEDAAWGWRDSDDVDYYWDGPTTVRQVRIAPPISTLDQTSKSSVLYKGKIVTLSSSVSKVNSYGIHTMNVNNVDDISITKHSAFAPSGLTNNVGCLCVMPNGRLHAYVIQEHSNSFGTSYYGLDLYVSDDGETFVLQKRNVLETNILLGVTFGAGQAGYFPTSISVAATTNSVVLLIDTIKYDWSEPEYLNRLFQYYSVDGGFTFTRLAEMGGTKDNTTGNKHKVIALPDDSYLVIYASNTTLTNEWLYQKKLRSALLSLADITGTAIVTDTRIGEAGTVVATAGSSYVIDAEIDITISQDNVLYLVYDAKSSASAATPSTIGIVTSVDFGNTWVEENNTFEAFSSNAFASLYDVSYRPYVYLRDISIASANGSLYIQCTATGWLVDVFEKTNTTSYDVNFLSLECGGWSSITRPFANNKISLASQLAFDICYLPITEMRFASTIWTVTPTGTVTQLLSTDAQDAPYLRSTTAAASTVGSVYTHVPGEYTARQHALIDVKVTTNRADFEFYQSSTLVGFSAAYRVRVTATQLIVSSLNILGTSATTLFTQSLPNPGGRHQIYIGIDEDASDDAQTVIYVGIRAHNAAVDSAFAWTEYSSAGEAKLGLFAKTQIEYNIPASSVVDLYGIQWGYGDYGICTNYTRELAKGGRLFSDRNVYAGKNVSISAYGGPTYIGDEWTIDPVYDYGLANLFEEGSPSPNVPWRATDDSEQNIIFRLSDFGDDASMMSKAMGVFFYNANFEKAEIYGSNTSGAGAWTLLDTIESNSGFEELSWVRKGDVIRPPAEDLSPPVPYIPMNALIGSTFYDNAEDASGKILANTEGVWIEGDLNVTPRIKIGTVSDPISTEEAGEGYIWIKDFGAIINNLADYEYIRIRIPACTTADGYISLGALVVGNVHYLGRRHGRQRTMSRDANVQTTTLRSGAKRTRVLGPTRRELTFSWANENEIDETQLHTSFVDPDYISIGGIPQNTVAGTTKLIEGIIEELQGEHGLVTYVSNVPSNGSIKPFSFLRGRIVSAYNEDVVLGNEMDNELKRVSSVTISEEV